MARPGAAQAERPAAQEFAPVASALDRTPDPGRSWLTCWIGCHAAVPTSLEYVPSMEAALTSDGKTRHRLRRNVTIGERRTSVSLEGHVWVGLSDICQREAIGIDALCTEVDRRRLRSSMSSSLRVFLLLYFRSLAEAIAERPVSDRRDGAGHLAAALDAFSTSEQLGEVA